MGGIKRVMLYWYLKCLFDSDLVIFVDILLGIVSYMVKVYFGVGGGVESVIILFFWKEKN